MPGEAQMSFRVHPALKELYERRKADGVWTSRLAAAGIFAMLKHPDVQVAAVRELLEFEAEYEKSHSDAARRLRHSNPGGPTAGPGDGGVTV